MFYTLRSHEHIETKNSFFFFVLTGLEAGEEAKACFPKSPKIKNKKLWLFHILLQTYTSLKGWKLNSVLITNPWWVDTHFTEET